MTPLGMPVVPPVYSSSRSSPLRPQLVSTTWAPDDTTDSYGVAQSGPGPVSSATTYQRRTPGSRSRMSSSSSPNEAWNTTASASALSKR